MQGMFSSFNDRPTDMWVTLHVAIIPSRCQPSYSLAGEIEITTYNTQYVPIIV